MIYIVFLCMFVLNYGGVLVLLVFLYVNVVCFCFFGGFICVQNLLHQPPPLHWLHQAQRTHSEEPQRPQCRRRAAALVDLHCGAHAAAAYGEGRGRGNPAKTLGFCLFFLMLWFSVLFL